MDEHHEVTPEVIDGLRRRDPDAVVAAYRAMADPLYGFLVRRSRDPAWAQDLVAEVFIEVIEGVGSFQGTPAAFRAWTFRIARNTLIDHSRKETRRRHGSIDDAAASGELPEAPGDTESDALSRVEASRLLGLVAQLSDDQEEVVLLRFVADLSILDVAEVTGKTPGAVKALQHRALRALRDRLQQDAGDDA